MHLQLLKRMHSYELGMWKGYHFSIEGVQKLVRKESFLKLKIKFSIDSKRFSKQNVSPNNVFRFETLHITSRRRICPTQAVILSSTRNSLSNFSATISALCNNNWWHLKSKLHLTIIKRLHNVLHQNSNGPLRKHRLSSKVQNGRVCWL